MSESEGFVKSDADASSSRKGAGDGDRKSSKTVLPVNCVMLNKLTHQSLGLVLQQHKYSSITIVGFVTEFQELGSRCEFKLWDASGQSVLVQQWKGGDDESGTPVARTALPLDDDSLVRVFGHPRKTANSKDPLVLASRITPVTDLNELTMHFLDVVTAHVALRKRKQNVKLSLPDVTGFPGTTGSEMGNMSFGEMSISKPTAGLTAGPAAPNSQLKAAAAPNAKDLVLKAITKDSSVQGISFTELESSLKSLNMKVIREAIDFLLTEGHIYTTTDDSHFKSLEG